MKHQDEKDTTRAALPRGFEINFHDEYMQITRQWFSLGTTIPILIVVLIFNGVWVSNGFLQLLTSDRDLLIKSFALLFIIVGAGSVYYCIASYFNKTQISVSRDAIEIKHHPIPWFGSKRVETNSIKQRFVKEKRWGSSNNNPNLTFNVLGLTNEAKPFKLIAGFKTSNQAVYIEQQIENYLGIENVEVSGEFK